MSQDSEDYINMLLTRARNGFLRLEEVVDIKSLDAAESTKSELEKLLRATENLDSPMVLVVDDEEGVRNVICRQMERRGFDCISAACADDAWELIETRVPQVIISDVLMPGTSGIEFLSQVMFRFPEMVMVMVSAAPDVSMTIEALRMGATDFLVKPIDFNGMEEAVRRGLDRRRARFNQLRYQLNLELIISERTRRVMEYSEALAAKTCELGLAYHDMVVRLGRASQWRDDETGAHVQRIGIFSAEIAREMGLTRDDVRLLAEAAPLHDIGKIGVPDSILLKPGKLTPEEYEIMKSHTLIGAAILSGSDVPLLKASESIALTHHEWFDGSGYPNGLKGEEIPLFGKIVAVADVYDALIHERTYKKAHSIKETLEGMASRRGTQFAPEVFDAFMKVAHDFSRLEQAIAEETQILPQLPILEDSGLRMGLGRIRT